MLHWVCSVGSWLLLVPIAFSTLAAAWFEKEHVTRLTFSWRRDSIGVLLVLFLLGDALAGGNRSTVERVSKGAAALLLVAAAGVAWARGARVRRRSTRME